eukprot:g3168.t1
MSSDWKQLFKNFTCDGLNMAQLKSSKLRGFKKKIGEQFPMLKDSPEQWESVFPADKKIPFYLVKLDHHVQILVRGDTKVPLFFNIRDGPFLPTLRLLHKYPPLLPRIQMDAGAIRFILKGANVFCVGLTGPGGSLPTENLPKGTPVGIFAQGKQHACAVGILDMSCEEIREKNKGAGILTAHYLGDGLWCSPVLK